MAGEPLHEGGVAVFAAVGAADVWIDGIFTYRQIGFGENAFDVHFLNDRGIHGDVPPVLCSVRHFLCQKAFLRAPDDGVFRP